MRGKVTVALTEPIDGRRLVVELRASQRGVETRGGVRRPRPVPVDQVGARGAGRRGGPRAGAVFGA